MINKDRLLRGISWISENIPSNAEATYVLEQLIDLVNRYECYYCQASLPREFAESIACDTADSSIDYKKFLMAQITSQFEQKLPELLTCEDVIHSNIYRDGPTMRASLEVILPKASDETPKSPKFFRPLDAIECGKEITKDETY